MTTAEEGESDPPYTTAELGESAIAKLDIEDQIRYAIYNEHYRLGGIVGVSAFSKEWTTDIIDEMVTDGDLEKGTDQNGPFYTLPESTNTSLHEDDRADIHERARREYEAETRIGDEADVAATMSSGISGSIEGREDEYADTAESMTAGPDDTVDPEETPDEEDVREALREHGGLLPVDRRYDWSEHKLDRDDVAEFISANGEKPDITTEIEERRESGKLPHFCISGPTGCGKTTLGEDIACDMDAVVIEIHCHEGLRPSNLLGMPTYVGDETWWIDGPVPKALLSSQEQPTVVILDEVNRTSSRVLGVLMSMLDHQCRVTLDGRGGETVHGDPMNLIVFSTMNEGEGYVVNSIDTAQKRRLGNKYYTDYIGMSDITEEADLIADRTPLDKTVAVELVEVANAIRRKAQSDSAIGMGVPTDTVLDWASTAWSYRDQDLDKGPLVKAGERAVLNKFYRGDKREEDTVRSTIESHLEGMGIEGDEDADELSGMSESADDASVSVSDETYLTCESCGWYAKAEDAPDEVTTSMQCPECSEHVIPKDGT